MSWSRSWYIASTLVCVEWVIVAISIAINRSWWLLITQIVNDIKFIALTAIAVLTTSFSNEWRRHAWIRIVAVTVITSWRWSSTQSCNCLLTIVWTKWRLWICLQFFGCYWNERLQVLYRWVLWRFWYRLFVAIVEPVKNLSRIITNCFIDRSPAVSIVVFTVNLQER